MYTPEEIERKKRQASEIRKQKQVSQSTTGPSIQKGVISNYSNQNLTPNSRSEVPSNFPSYLSKQNLSFSQKSTKTSGNYKSTFSNANNQSPYAAGSSQNKIQSNIKQQTPSNRYNPMGNANKFYGTDQVCEVNCYMTSQSRFVADMLTYNAELIELFKTIPSRLYDTKTKIWNFHINDYEKLSEKVINLKSKVTFKGLPTFVLKTCRTFLQQEKQSNQDLSKIDPTLVESLYSFQREGIEYGIMKNGKCLIADDMGLGKTRQALGLGHYYKSDWPMIIITPSSVRYQWSEAILEHLPSVPANEIQHVITTKDYLETSQITIISYDLLGRRIDELAARRFGVVICDESHYMKNAKTVRTKSVQCLTTNARRIILLTGTPALSRPIELHPQIKLLVPTFMSYHDFGFRYCAGEKTKFGLNFNGSSNLKELEIILKATCLIRRLKKDVMSQLPSKIRQKIMLDPHLIKASTKEMKTASKNMEKNDTHSHSALLEYYSATSRAKEKAVCNYIADLIENEQKFLVFAHHKTMLDAICDLLHSKKILYIRIDGRTKPESRKEYVDLFQQDDKVLVAVLSITAANAGITMTSAQLVLFAELSWNPGILCQAEDRVHRIGQTDNVVIRYLLAKETADDYLWPQIQKKIDVLNEVGLDQNIDLDQADVSNQTSHYQQRLDDFFDTQSSHEKSVSSSNPEASENVELQTNSQGLKDLLDIDDDAFDSIDLDNIF